MKPTPSMLARLEEMLLEAERDLRFARKVGCGVSFQQTRVDALRNMVVFREVPERVFNDASYRF